MIKLAVIFYWYYMYYATGSPLCKSLAKHMTKFRDDEHKRRTGKKLSFVNYGVEVYTHLFYVIHENRQNPWQLVTLSYNNNVSVARLRTC